MKSEKNVPLRLQKQLRMLGDEKHRAARNRTLTVSAEEIPALEPMVSVVDDLRAGFRDDLLVNDIIEEFKIETEAPRA